MITLNFHPVKKVSNKGAVKIKQDVIVQKNVAGVVHITLEGIYYIPFNDTIYYIAKNCYNCKGKRTLFYKGLLNGNNIKVIKLDKFVLSDYTNYLPFTVGCYVKGDLIKEDGIIKFSISKLLKYDENIKIERVNAIKFFRKNYEEICQNLML